MKWILIALIAAVIISLSFVSTTRYGPKQMDPNTEGSFPPFAVLELFTSEGCSSCPPADNLLPQLTKLDSNIIPLSFHVDYWNRLGWEDPFSKSEFSERQREYARQFNLENIYTPQLVVNGEYEFIGSDKSYSESIITKALKQKATVRLTIMNVTQNSGKLNFSVHAEGDFKNADLMAALVQKQVIMKVKAGENRGATLSHTNVVREFSMQTASTETQFELTIPGNILSGGWQIVVYARGKKDLKITGAVLYNPQLRPF